MNLPLLRYTLCDDHLECSKPKQEYKKTTQVLKFVSLDLVGYQYTEAARRCGVRGDEISSQIVTSRRTSHAVLTYKPWFCKVITRNAAGDVLLSMTRDYVLFISNQLCCFTLVTNMRTHAWLGTHYHSNVY